MQYHGWTHRKGICRQVLVTVTDGKTQQRETGVVYRSMKEAEQISERLNCYCNRCNFPINGQSYIDESGKLVCFGCAEEDWNNGKNTQRNH